MKSDKPVLVIPPRSHGPRPVLFDRSRCVGCNACVEVCPQDVLVPNPEKGAPPLVAHPGECWYEGSCVAHCPVAGAVSLNHPLMRRVRWKRKETGEGRRL